MIQARPHNEATRKILKALSVFGGVQVFGILCSIVRTKLVALWIGPLGVGLITLFLSATDFLSTVTQLNLRQSAVRDVSQTSAAGLGRISSIVRKIALVLGLAGMAVCLLASPLIGWITFGSSGYAPAFAILSPLLLLAALTSGEQSLMQGSGRLKALANSTMWATVLATVCAVPLFWFLRQEGIVPVLLIFGLSNYLFARLFRDKGVSAVHTSVADAFREGRPMLALGFYMTIGAAATTLASYLFAAYLNRSYSETTVGLYQTGFTLVNTYVGLIFTAITMEYYPRLSAVAKHPRRMQPVVCHEIIVALTVLVPVTVLFICCRELMVKLLYSSRFLAVLPYISIGIIGVAFRAASWCVAFTILARGDGRMYVVTEVLSSAIGLTLNIFGYRYYGFAGLGAAYVIWYALYLVITYSVYRLRYGCRLSRGVWLMLFVTVAMGCLTLWLSNVIGPWLTLLVALPPSVVVAYRMLMR